MQRWAAFTLPLWWNQHNCSWIDLRKGPCLLIDFLFSKTISSNIQSSLIPTPPFKISKHSLDTHLINAPLYTLRYMVNSYSPKCDVLYSPDSPFLFGGGSGNKTISNLAPSWVYEEAPVNTSPSMGRSSGSMQTSLQTSVGRLAVRSLISLCQMEGKPSLVYDRACLMENVVPCTSTYGGSLQWLQDVLKLWCAEATAIP